jgi:hypothetical protein
MFLLLLCVRSGRVEHEQYTTFLRFGGDTPLLLAYNYILYTTISLVD